MFYIKGNRRRDLNGVEWVLAFGFYLVMVSAILAIVLLFFYFYFWEV